MTTVGVGIGLAFVAMLCWGFGDFLIQRSVRKIGDWESLFAICGLGALVLLPFVWKELPSVAFGQAKSLLILLGTGLILFVAAIFDFEALKRGKLAVVEPIWSLEVPAAALLALFILGEKISILQTTLISILVVGLVLVSIKEKYSLKKFFVEKGVAISFFAAFLMGSANFFYGWGARVTDPLIVNFFVNAFVTAVTGLYLLARGRMAKALKDLASNRAVILSMCLADNSAWIAFAFAMTLAPIAVATALSESYIIIAVLLGLFINREKLQFHQKVGLIGAIATAVALAAITAA